MSTTIDEKVVEMRFDNKDFEKNVHTSMETLSSLKKSLKFDDASRTFSNLEKASKKLKFDGITNAIETVKVKFSGLQIAAARIFTNIVDDAYYAGKRLVKSLSVDQISAGWEKYAQKTSSVQTIMAATAKDFEDTGEQMEFVNDQLEKLNWFTDETSYSFLDMVNNIGKFTSNNVKLEDAVTAMQGISNWAAVSGGTINEASRAMYNLSQALAMGEVKLMDWRSIQNANMATYEFKEQVLDTALALGKVTKAGEDAYKVGSKTYSMLALFDEGLSQGWFTSDVLLTTLKKYGEFTNKLYEASEEMDLTATEMLQAIDKYKEGTVGIDEIARDTGVDVTTLSKHLTILSDDTYELGRKAFKAAQEAKTFREAIDSVKDAVSTGWMNTFEYIFGDYQTAKSVWTTVANELYDVFAEAGNARNELLRLWELLGGRETLFQGISNIWNNLKNILGSVRDGFREIFPKATVETLIKITTGFRDLTERLMANEEVLDKIRRTFKGIAALLDIGRQIFSALWGGLKQVINLVKPFGGSILDTAANIGDFLVKLRDWTKENEIFAKAVNNIINLIKFLASGIDNLFRKITGYGVVDLVKKLGDNLSYAYQKISLIFKLLFGHNTPREIVELADSFKELTGISFKDSKLFKFFHRTKQIFIGFRTLISDLVHGDKFGDAVKKFFGSSFGFNPDAEMGKIGEAFKKAWSKISEAFESMKSGFGEFSKIIKERWDKIKEAFSGAKDVIVEAWKKIQEVISEVTGTDLKGMTTFGKVISVLLYPIQLFFTGLKYVFQGLGLIIEDFGPAILTFLKKIGGSVIDFGKKIGTALKNADFNKFVELITSGSLAIILGKLVKSLLGLSKIGDTLRSFGEGDDGKFSIFVFLKNLYNNGKKVTERIGQVFTELLDSIRGVFVAWQRDLQASTILKIALAIGVLAAALVMLSGIDQNSLTTAVGAITILFTELAAVFKLISSSMVVEEIISPDGVSRAKKTITSFAQISVFMISLSASLILMSSALKKIASLDQDQLKRGLIGFTALFAELTIFLKYIAKEEAISQIAIKGLVTLATSLYIMSMAVKKLSKLDTKEMLQGIGGMGLILLSLLAFLKLLGNNMKTARMPDGTIQFQSFVSIANGLLILSVAIKMMASTVKKLGKMDPKALEQGLVGFAGILAIIDAFIYLFKSPRKEEAGIMRIASMMVVMSTAMVLMASSLKIIGTMNFEQVSNALLGFAGVMSILVLTFSNVAGNKNTVGAAGSILMIVNSMIAIAAAMKIMGTMDFEHMASATLGFAGALGTMIVALNYLKGEALEILKLSGAILVFSMAFTVLATAMKIMSTINGVDLAKSVVAISTVFGIMSLFSAFTEGFNAIKAATSILILAAALTALVPPLVAFKVIDIGNVITMTAALGGIIAVLGIAATTLSGSILPLMAVSGSIALLGAGILMLGAGFVSLAAGLAALGASLPVFAEFMAMLSAALLAFIPQVILAGTEAILKAIVNFGKDILLVLIDTANAILPPLVELIFNFIDALLASLANHLPSITMNLINLLLDMLDIIGKNSYRIINGLLNLVFDLLEGFGQAFKQNIRRAVDVVTDLVMNVIGGALDAVFGWIGDLIFGKTEETIKNVEDLITEEQKTIVDKVDAMNRAYEEADKSRDISIKGIQNEYQYMQDLADEYNSLVGANGQIKQGYEDRAEAILTTLANAMGIERDEIDKLIEKNGKLEDSYKDVITVMQAEAYLSANKDIYTQAIRNKSDDYNAYIESLYQYTEATKKYKEITEELDKAQKEYYEDIQLPGNYQDEKAIPLFERINELEKLKDDTYRTLGYLRSNADEAADIYAKNANEIMIYEGLMVSAEKGNVESMQRFMDYYNNDLILGATGTERLLSSQVTDQKIRLEELESLYKQGLGNITEAQLEAQRVLYGQAVGEYEKFKRGITSISYDIGEDTVSETARGVIDNKGSLYNASELAIDSYKEPYEELPEDIKGLISESDYSLLQEYGIGMDMIKTLSDTGGKDAVDAFVNSISGKSDDVANAGTGMAEDFTKPIAENANTMGELGDDYVDGFVNRVTSTENINKLDNAGKQVGNTFSNSVAEAGDVHSPSRVMDRIGGFYMLGLVNGILRLKSLVVSSAKDVAETSIDSMSETMSRVSDVLSSDLNVDPTIRPVVDLSSVQDGVNSINGMFGSNYSKLMGTINLDSKKAIEAKIQNGVTVNNSDVVGAIGKLRSDVNTLNQNMSRLQVVMDTGALVGQIVSPMDASLGRQTLLKQRGV